MGRRADPNSRRQLEKSVRNLMYKAKKEFKFVKKQVSNGKWSNDYFINQNFLAEISKIKWLTGTTRPFSLGRTKGKTSEELKEIKEELEQFLSDPYNRFDTREKKFKERKQRFMEDWDLSEKETDNFYRLMNSTEIKDALETQLLNCTNVMDLAERDDMTAKDIIKATANLTSGQMQELQNLPNSEKMDTFVDIIKNAIRGN